MALNGLILDQRNNTSKNWRNILAEIMEDGIFRDGCEITFTSNSITVGGGYFIQRGAVIENDGAETIPITPTLTNGYVRLICRVDLTKEATETGPGQVEWATDFSATSTFPALVQEDILQAGSVYEIEVAVLQITSGNITAITRKIGNATIDAEKLGGKTEKQLSVSSAATANDLTYGITQNISVPTNIYKIAATARTFGGSVFLDLFVYGQSDEIPHGGLIASIDNAEVRPKSAVGLPAVAYKSDLTTVPCNVVVQPNGQVSYYTVTGLSAMTIKWVEVTGWYKV